MENGMEKLYTFLQRRNIPEENLKKLQNDKIEISFIESMEDNTLAAYILIYGDRIATRRFCLQHKIGEKDAQKQSLLQKLQRKMGIASAVSDEEEPGPFSR